jgi:glucan-binding YG repeat protein
MNIKEIKVGKKYLLKNNGEVITVSEIDGKWYEDDDGGYMVPTISVEGSDEYYYLEEVWKAA